jgi:hypothetical protein
MATAWSPVWMPDRTDSSRRRPSRAVALAAVFVFTAVALAVIVVIASSPTPPSPLGVSSRLQSLDVVTPTAPEHAEHPDLALVSAMAPWRALEPTDDAFDWSQLDANVADARDHGYRLIVRIMAGRVAPTWLAEQGARMIEVYGSDPNAIDHCDVLRVPAPWDPVLETEYRELMDALGAWLRGSDGAGGTRADHVAIVPVAMPTVLGSEMTLSYGPPGPCPQGTDAAGLDLRATNRAAWDAVASELERRALLEQAWRSAVAIHMTSLPEPTASAIAYGHLFDDRQAAALRIAREEVAVHSDRLWSMYTNLQAKHRPDGSIGPWTEVCPRCDEVLRAAADSGGGVGFQLASLDANDSLEGLRSAVEGALAAYPVGFIEAQPGAIDVYGSYLLEGSGSVQARILVG